MDKDASHFIQVQTKRKASMFKKDIERLYNKGQDEFPCD